MALGTTSISASNGERGEETKREPKPGGRPGVHQSVLWRFGDSRLGRGGRGEGSWLVLVCTTGFQKQAHGLQCRASSPGITGYSMIGRDS